MELFLIPILLTAGVAGLFIDFGGDDDAPSTSNNRLDLDGGDGNDNLQGRFAADNLDGGDGNDTLNGGNGSDRLFGGNGDDIILGDGNYGAQAVGRDYIHGGEGDDIIIGNNGADTIFGNDDDSTSEAVGSDNDMIFAGFGGDRVFGEAGDDTIIGHRGEDTIRGGSGNDVITGNMLYLAQMQQFDAEVITRLNSINSPSDIPTHENGRTFGDISQRDDFKDDSILGDAGDDTLYIGELDIAAGGLDNDTFILSKDSGFAAEAGKTPQGATITDFTKGEDNIVVEYASNASAPTITLAVDGTNVNVLANGTVVANLTNAAVSQSGLGDDTITLSDITTAQLPSN